jgi:hypothetical protein
VCFFFSRRVRLDYRIKTAGQERFIKRVIVGFYRVPGPTFRLGSAAAQRRGDYIDNFIKWEESLGC